MRKPTHIAYMSDQLDELEKNLAEAKTEKDQMDAKLALAHHHMNDDFIEGYRLGQEALDLAKILIEKEAEALAHEVIAGCLWKLSDYTLAMEHYETALDGFLSLGDLYHLSKCHCGIGIIHGINEDYQMALERFEEALRCAKKADKLQMAATVTGNIGHIYLNLGRYKDALDCYEYTYEYQKSIGFKLGAADMLSGMAGVHVLQGEYDKGLELARRAVEAAKAANHQRGVAVGIMNVGEALKRMGKPEEAKKEYKKALNYARSINLVMTETDVLKKLSEVCDE
ncbi:MAG: tetratricopeptide repeat protein, partial [Flavobacteriales bacterium]|nr:tetratricopeptide repeat protein [Flavobacteriales bacterium]